MVETVAVGTITTVLLVLPATSNSTRRKSTMNSTTSTLQTLSAKTTMYTSIPTIKRAGRDRVPGLDAGRGQSHADASELAPLDRDRGPRKGNVRILKKGTHMRLS